MLKQGDKLFMEHDDLVRHVNLSKVTKRRAYFAIGGEELFVPLDEITRRGRATAKPKAAKSVWACERPAVFTSSVMRDRVRGPCKPFGWFNHLFRFIFEVPSEGGLVVHSYHVRSMKAAGLMPSEIARAFCGESENYKPKAKAEFCIDGRFPYLRFPDAEAGNAASGMLLHALRGGLEYKIHKFCDCDKCDAGGEA